MKNPSKIRNKSKRVEIYAKYKQQKKVFKKKLREERLKEVEALGDDAPPKQVPKTIESMREIDETTVAPNDDEVVGDEADDEFSEYYNNEKKPKIMITTRPNCSKKLYPFIADLMQMIPNAFFYPRESLLVREMMAFAAEKAFTHIIVLSEKNKSCDGSVEILLTCEYYFK